MRYYFHDNQPNSFTRFALSGIALVTLVAAVGGFNYSRGLPFSSNPFAGSDSWNEAKTSDDQNLEKIFIPIRKEFPPDPFHGVTEEAAPTQPKLRAPIKSQSMPPENDTAISSVLPDTSNAVTLKQALSGSAIQNKPSGNAKAALIKDNAEAVTDQKLKNREEIREISEFSGVPESVIDRVKNKQIIRVKAPDTPEKRAIAKVNSLDADGGVKPVKSIQVMDVTQPVRKAVEQPAIVKIDETLHNVALTQEQPKFKQLETIVEISDSGETVAGKRWKDVSNFSE